MTRRAFDVVVAGAALARHRARSSRSRSSRSGWSRTGHPIYRQRRVGKRRRAVRHAQAAHDGRRRRAHGRRAWPSTRATRASRASARSCAAPRSTSCRTSSTSCAARWRSSARARRSRSQVEQYTERQRGRLAVKPGHHRLGAGQRPRVAAVGRAHRARPLVRRAPLAGASTSRSSCARARDASSAATASTRARPAAGNRANFRRRRAARQVISQRPARWSSAASCATTSWPAISRRRSGCRRRPQLKDGGRYRIGPGLIEIDAIELVPFAEITVADVRRAGEIDREILRDLCRARGADRRGHPRLPDLAPRGESRRTEP